MKNNFNRDYDFEIKDIDPKLIKKIIMDGQL